MAGITTYLSILTLNGNGLNFPIKRHLLANRLKRKIQQICCLQEMHLINRNKHCHRVKGWKKTYQDNGPWKQVGVAMLTSDKEDFKFTLAKWSQASNNAMSFLFSLMFYLQWDWRRGQHTFCFEVRGDGGGGGRLGERWPKQCIHTWINE
jgi:hypothetical protein